MRNSITELKATAKFSSKELKQQKKEFKSLCETVKLTKMSCFS